MLDFHKICFAILLTLLLTAPAQAQTTQPAEVRKNYPYIAPYLNNAQAAYSLTFDDGTKDQVELAVPLLEKYQLKATFYICPAWVPEVYPEGTPPTKAEIKAIKDKKERRAAQKRLRDFSYASWEDWKKVSAMGHEIGNHSMWHPNFKHMKEDEEKLKAQIIKPYEIIKQKIGKEIPMSFCYPFNARTPVSEKMVDALHFGARRYQWHYGGKGFTTDKANSFVNQDIAKKNWGIAMLHGVTAHYSPTSPEVLEEHFKYLARLQKEGKLWVAPFREVWQYRWQREHTKILDYQKTDGEISFRMECKKPLSYPLKPVTLLIAIEHAKEMKAVIHQGKAIDYQLDGHNLSFTIIPTGKVKILFQ